VSKLLEAWFAIASTSWAPTTTRETRSILDRCPHPHLGHLRVGDVTTAVIDATYATLRERVTEVIRPLSGIGKLNALATGPAALWVATGILQRFDIQ
jgi:hypothetical protein